MKAIIEKQIENAAVIKIQDAKGDQVAYRAGYTHESAEAALPGIAAQVQAATWPVATPNAAADRVRIAREILGV